MPYKIIKQDEPLPDKKLVIVLYGPPGSFKTSVAFTAPNPILLNFDDGLHRSVKRKTAVSFDKWEDCEDFCDSQDFIELNPETIIIDTAGAVLDDFMAQAVIKENSTNKKHGGGLSQTGYGSLKLKFDQFFARFRNKKHIIFLCHEGEDKKKDLSVVRPKMTGGSYQIMIAKADLIGYMDVTQDDTGNPQVTIDFNPSDTRYAKNFAEFKPQLIPDYNAKEYDGFMTGLIDSANERMKSLSDEQQKAIKIMEDIRARLEDVKDRREIEEIEKEICSMSKTYQLQLSDQLEATKMAIMSIEFEIIEDFDTVMTVFSNEVSKLNKSSFELVQDNFEKLFRDKFTTQYFPEGEMTLEQINSVASVVKALNHKYLIGLASPVLLKKAEEKGFITIEGQKGFHPIVKPESQEQKQGAQSNEQPAPKVETPKEDQKSNNWPDLPDGVGEQAQADEASN